MGKKIWLTGASRIDNFGRSQPVMKKTILPAVLAVVFSPAVLAQGPDRSLVPADASFVVHVDLQRVFSVLGLDDLMDTLEDRDARELSDVLGRVEDRLRFNPREDIRSVTVFGRDLNGRTPGVVFITTDALDDALAALEEDGVVSTDRQGGLRFQIISGRGLVEFLRVEGADVGDNDSLAIFVKELRGNRRAVLVGERPDDILGAARVFEDQDLSLAGRRDTNLELRASSGSIVYVEATNSMEELLGESPASMLADKVRGLAVDVSEEQDNLRVQLTVATSSARDARDVESIIVGLRGLISLAEGLEDLDDLPEIARGILNELDADADGNRVTVSVALPLAELRRALRDR